MIIGVDFDNTIVCYDGIFHRVALERGLIPEDLPQDKTTVRNYLREIGREDDWTEMQGYVYGPRLIDAQPYPGVLEFFRTTVQQEVEVRIVSHKTKHPFRGERHDLHAAAWNWLEANGFFDTDCIGIRREQVFLELTKESKHQRIGMAGCTHFIDDLPEFLLDEGFPKGIERIHFDPCGTANLENSLRSARSWSQLSAELLPDPAIVKLAQSVTGEDDITLSSVAGGANNRIHHARGNLNEVIVKAYHHADGDQRDRFLAEQRFYQLNLYATPKPLGWDSENRLGAFEAIQGTKLSADEVSSEDVQQCIDWICGIQESRNHRNTFEVGAAADACFSIEDHLQLVERRVHRLIREGEDHNEFQAFVSDSLVPHVESLVANIRANNTTPVFEPLSQEHRILSPSDFGFHNALKDGDERLWFFDFEYAGWDDPAKLLCDYFCQPQIPVTIEYADSFVEALRQTVDDPDLPARFRLMLPLHAAKWTCILLNEFIKSDADRRRFAGLQDRRPVQLEKAHAMLAKSLSFC